LPGAGEPWGSAANDTSRVSRARGVKPRVPPPTRPIASETAGQRHLDERADRPEEPRDHEMIMPLSPSPGRRRWLLAAAVVFAKVLGVIAYDVWLEPRGPLRQDLTK
jgi:hypothetical protein